MLQDVRFALRQLRRHRAYAVIAVLTIALGVGANAAVFSIADAVLFRPLPFRDADRLFVLRLGDVQTGKVFAMLPGSAVDAARVAGVFDGIGGASSRVWRAYVRESAGLNALALAPVSQEYLDLLGVRPILGRRFDATDAGTRAVLLTHRAWIKRYGGDPTIVDRDIPAILRPTEAYPLPQTPLRIAGVLPAGMHFPLLGDADGLLLNDERVGGAEDSFAPLVRLAPNVTSETARARLAALQWPERVPNKSILRLVPIREELAGRQDAALWLLLGAAAIVLVVACVNLANLILARGIARGRELAVRAALGGSRARVVRLLLAEAACITIFGAALGFLFAYWGFRGLSAWLPPGLARVVEPAFDARVLVFGTIAAVLSTTTFSLWPVLRLSRTDRQAGLRSRLDRFQAVWRGRQVLVGLEVAICVMLVIGAGLVGRSLLTLTSQDLGFEPHRVAVTFDLPTLVVQQGNQIRTDRVARSAFYVSRLREIRALPGVRAAALASAPPFSGRAPDAALTDRRGEQGGVYSVSSGYFRTMGIPFVAGRDFTDEESFNRAPVGVLNEAAVRMLCGDVTSCLGRTIPSPEQPARTIVGVVRDSRQRLQGPAAPVMYAPPLTDFAIKTLVIDADGSRASQETIIGALSVSPEARVSLESLDEDLDREISPFRFNAVVIGGFASLTLILAVVGVGGVMAAAVGERTREFGIRLALGATSARVHRLVLRHAAVPVVIGSICGLAGAAVAVRFVASLLYGVRPLDPAAFFVSLALVAMTGVAAAWPSARRAGRVDPIVCLRAE